jgi:tetratricopeptide (TPR) repeat protein
LDEAEQYLSKAIEIDPAHVGAQFALGDMLLRQNRPEEAVPHFQRVLVVRPDWREARQKLDQAMGKKDPR